MLFLTDVLRWRWGRLAVAGATALLSLALGALIVGPAGLAAYVHANPAAREPAFAFVEVENQSLLAVVSRLHAVLPLHISPFHEPLYLAGAFFFGIVTLALCARPAVSGDVAFAATLLLGLIVYPGTLSSYEVVLIVPLLVVWKYRETFPGQTATVCGLIAAAILLASLSLQQGFVGTVLLWVACSYLLVVQRGEVPQERPVPLRTAGTQRVEIAR